MRTLLCAVAALCFAGTIAPPLTSAQAPTEDFVIAQGRDASLGLSFRMDITASSGPSGEDPTGRVFFSFAGSVAPAVFPPAEVTCLAVADNTAIVGFVGMLSVGGPIGPVAGVIRLTDGGGPGSNEDIFEMPLSLIQFPLPTLPPDCATFPATEVFQKLVFPSDEFTGEPLGDIVVHDALAFPTSKDQCKNGGWGDFGLFKNQGDCVSFVATGGKNLPGGH